MDRKNRFRRILPLIVMVCAGVLFVVGLMPVFLGHGPVGIVSAMIGAVVALMTKKITDRHREQRKLMALNAELERRVKERTAQLDAVNKDLEAFSYSVAHDLRGPLQQLVGFVDLLQTRSARSLDVDSTQYLSLIRQSVWGMSYLIDDLLEFSRAERLDLRKSQVSVEELIAEARHQLQHQVQGRAVSWKVGTLPQVYADRAMLRLVIVNLLSNALKFSSKRSRAEIEVGSAIRDNQIEVFVRDNGVGFDMKNVDKLFGVFQRLHTKNEFDGNGIGLASVQRIIHRHGGRTWAEGRVGEGATFWFSLPHAHAASRDMAETEVEDRVPSNLGKAQTNLSQ